MAQWNPNTWPSFQQSLPMLQGYQAGLAMQYQPQMNNARLAQMQAQTEGQQIQNQAFPDELKLKQYLADIAYKNAVERGRYNDIQNKKIPILEGNLADRTATTPAGQSALGSNKSLMGQFLSGLAGTLGGFSNYGQAMGNPQTPITDADVAQAQDDTQSALLKKTTTNQVLNQRQYGDVLEGIGNQIESDLPQIKQYFGALGKGQLTIDSLKKNKPESYQKYYNFMTKDAPLYANELRRMLGGQASDHEIALMNSIVNPDWNLANGEIAIKNFEALRNLEARTRQSLNKSLAQVHNQSFGQPTAQPSAFGTPSVVNSVPVGSIEMIDPQGNSRVVPVTAREQALSAGWRVA